jgi:nucleoside-diphosphate-sugar epimerase
MERVLVTGATGFIGFELVRQLCAAGLRPRILVRRPHRAAVFASFDVEPVHGDLLSPATLQRAVDGVDTVFHLGARASFESYRKLAPTIVAGTDALARAAVRAGVEHFVYASSLFVYDAQDEPIDRTTPPVPRLGYGKAKLEVEQALAGLQQESGMTVASLRLPHVYGPHGILFSQIRRGIALFPGRMGNRCGQLHVTDAARALHAAGQQRWSGALPVTDSETVTWMEYFRVLAELFPRHRLIRLPRWIGLSGAAMLEPLLSWRDRPTLYTKDTVIGFNLDLPVRPGLLWDELDMEPAFPTVRDGIPDVLDSYVHFRWRHPMMDRRSD